MSIPETGDIVLYKRTIHVHFSMLKNVYEVADGLKLMLEHRGDTVIREMLYNDCTYDHYSGTFLYFLPVMLSLDVSSMPQGRCMTPV